MALKFMKKGRKWIEFIVLLWYNTRQIYKWHKGDGDYEKV